MSAVSSMNELVFSVATTAGASVRADEPVGEMTDHRLLEVTKTGDGTAFAELVRRYRNQITNYVYRMTNDYDLAVDLAQETFMRVYAAAERYQSSYAFSTYIYRIATNLAISELRRRKRRRMISLSSFFQERESPSDSCELEMPDTGPLQDVTVVEDERRAAIARAIASLPEKYRAPLVLRDVEERSYEEIACILGMNEGTVKSRINRARTFLRDKLKAYL
jgi:RNA polymerase sigma-70 factor (ECF subfamily)